MGNKSDTVNVRLHLTRIVLKYKKVTVYEKDDRLVAFNQNSIEIHLGWKGLQDG